MTTGTWLDSAVEAIARDKILDAAGALFAQSNGARINMADIADAAGCSRATLYRYFEGRDALRAAYVHREARRIGALVATEVASIDDPRLAVTERIMTAIRHVRTEPVLHAWFAPDKGDMGSTAAQSGAIEAMVATSLGDREDPDVVRRARWIVRVIVSLLTMPETSDTEERALVDQFVAPVVA